ncbi:hypothetical protein KY345_06160 [Candidatus Woesearchaeota archaeon]|nr:hypothetical protein [Candidatus Woesearchaeota archaeon]
MRGSNIVSLGMIVALSFEALSLPSREAALKKQTGLMPKNLTHCYAQEYPVSDLYDITVRLTEESSNTKAPSDTVSVNKDLFYSHSYNLFFRKKGRNRCQSLRPESIHFNTREGAKCITLCLSYTDDKGKKAFSFGENIDSLDISLDPFQRELSFNAIYLAEGTRRKVDEDLLALMNRTPEKIIFVYK